MALPEEEQMDAVFKSSRTNVDPVSGNDVPPGSLPEEVRDDIPAQLSEGEYVVPADVLRFYGMKFFEDLRKEAKIELARMNEEGRIGGEPMGEMEDDDLTPEEMSEIDTMMMAIGGYVTEQPTQATQPDPYAQQQMLYKQGAPVAMGNTGFAEGGQVRGYQAAGQVTAPPPAGTQANIDFSQFGAGFSFSPNAQQNLQQMSEAVTPVPTFTPVKMYAPDGTEVTANTQEEYNSYLSQGYTMAPPAVKPSDDGGTTPTETEPQDPTSWADGLDFTDGDQVQAMVDEMLGVSKGEKTAAKVGLMGAALVGLNRATGVARSRALAGMIKDINPELSESIIKQANKTVSDSSNFLSLLPNEVIDGDQILKQLQSKFGTTSSEILTNMIGTKSAKLYTERAATKKEDPVAWAASEDKAMTQTADPSSGGTGSLVGKPQTEEEMAAEAGSVKQADGSYDISSWYSS